MNILNKSFDRIPGFNLLRARYRERLASTDAGVQAEAAGEMATGVMISTGLVMLASEGRITGGGPADPKKRAMWTRDGNWQPYSINVGTKENPEWISYRRLDPWFFSFGVAADYMEAMQASNMDPSFDGGDWFATVVAGATNNVLNKTWLQGISDLVEVLNSGERSGVVQRWMEDRVASFVPFSAFSRSMNREGDEFVREASGYIDKLKMNVWGMGADLPMRYDWIDGGPMEKPEKLLWAFDHKRASGDPVDAELRRLRYGFTGPDRKIGGVTLSPAMYQDWNRLTGTVRIGGKTLKEALAAEMQNPGYDIARDRVPDGATTPSESHRVKALAPVIAAYKQVARAELFGLHPELFDAWEKWNDYNGRAKSGEDVAGQRENLILNF